MTKKANNGKNAFVALIIVIILAVTIISVLMQTNFEVNSDKINIQDSTQSSPVNGADTNQTNPQNTTNNPPTPNNTAPICSDNTNTTPHKQTTPPQFASLLLYDARLNQAAKPDITPPTSATTPVSLEISDFQTYTYGCDSAQQTSPNQFFFSFPNSTNQGEIAGSDAISLCTYSIQKIEFNAVFKSPKTDAVGFDEMAIFAASNTTTYKGTEFGVRMDLNDGLIFGYIQEPNGEFGDVDFQMVLLTSNDGLMHHYTLIAYECEVLFWIDGVEWGHLTFPSNTGCVGFTFSVCAVVHRFTDNWDSSGDTMFVENFVLNQP
jgi:hypothetical protein